MTGPQAVGRVAELRSEQDELVFRTFDSTDAWLLGSRMARRAIDDHLPAAIDIRKPGRILFRASFDATTPDVEVWIARKAAVAQRLEKAGALVLEELAALGVDAADRGWLDPADYAVCGGTVPVRVAGVGVVGVVTVSGLTSEQAEHDLAATSMREHIAWQAERDAPAPVG